MNTLLRALVLLLVLSGCKSVGDLGREQLGVSVLVVNMRDIYNVPQGPDGTPWPVRFQRIADWIQTASSLPDVIALQEAPGYWDCGPDDPTRLQDYAALDFLLDAIRINTGKQYRIAYLISHKMQGGEGDGWIMSDRTGGCTARGGRALLYLPSRIRNVQASVPTIGFGYDDELNFGVHLINSLPCCNPAARRADVCGFIDGPSQMAKCNRPTPSGAAWTRRQSTSERNNDAVFSRLELIGGGYLHLYNLHIKHTGGPALIHARPATDSINALVTSMEMRYARAQSDLLYPPILLGDFNLSAVDAAGEFPRFREVLWTLPPDVMGAMLGVPTVFPAKQTAYVNATEIMPAAECGTAGNDEASRWSDHCAIFFRIEPVRP